MDSLGNVPLDITVRERTDEGKPVVAAEPDGLVGRVFRDIAWQIAARVALKPKDMTGMFPPVTVQS